MKNCQNLLAYNFDAAVVSETLDETDSLPYRASHVSLHTANAVYPAITWLPSTEINQYNGNVTVGHVYACNLIVAPEQRSQLVLTRIDSEFNGRGLPYVCSSACPIEGEVDAVRALVSRIHSTPLKAFVEEALTNIDAFRWFWTCPASLANHHSQAGGLAAHSRHVAEQASLAVCDQSQQSDFAIAYGLLHDYGKIWSYDNGHVTEIAHRLGHEQIGYEKLLPLLLKLRKVWPDGGVVMQSLLSGQWKRDGQRPIQAVGNIVKSLDQYSAESDMGRRQNKNTKWQPTFV